MLQLHIYEHFDLLRPIPSASHMDQFPRGLTWCRGTTTQDDTGLYAHAPTCYLCIILTGVVTMRVANRQCSCQGKGMKLLYLLGIWNHLRKPELASTVTRLQVGKDVVEKEPAIHVKLRLRMCHLHFHFSLLQVFGHVHLMFICRRLVIQTHQ